MRKICGILVSFVILFGTRLSIANSETVEYINIAEEYHLADTPTKYGFKGLYTLFSPDTYWKGQFGIGVYWGMTRFCLPGDPRYPELQEFTLAGAYGVTDRLEVGIAVPFRHLSIPAASSTNRMATDDALGDISESGFSNVSVGVRFHLLGDGEEGFNLSPYILAFLPTAQDPKKGHGAENTRIHFGVSVGKILWNPRKTRLYGQITYQFATDYDQDRRDFTETTPHIPDSQPRFERFGTNPLFHEYGNTLFYGAGFAFPVLEDAVELFSEFLFYHSFEDKDYIPMFENSEALDVVQNGGMAHVGAKVGFGNGFTLTASWGSILFAEEPMYESPIWKVFAGLTYNSPELVEYRVSMGPPFPPDIRSDELEEPEEPIRLVSPPIDEPCVTALAMIHFEFDKSALTPEAIETLKGIGQYMRLCEDTLVLEVQGHTDWIGTENYNMGLANRRARAVVYYLVYDEGIDPTRIIVPEKLAKGIIAGETYGETQPIASNETDTGRATNRRVQFMHH